MSGNTEHLLLQSKLNVHTKKPFLLLDLDRCASCLQEYKLKILKILDQEDVEVILFSNNKKKAEIFMLGTQKDFHLRPIKELSYSHNIEILQIIRLQ